MLLLAALRAGAVHFFLEFLVLIIIAFLRLIPRVVSFLLAVRLLIEVPILNSGQLAQLFELFITALKNAKVATRSIHYLPHLVS